MHEATSVQPRTSPPTFFTQASNLTNTMPRVLFYSPARSRIWPASRRGILRCIRSLHLLIFILKLAVSFTRGEPGVGDILQHFSRSTRLTKFEMCSCSYHLADVWWIFRLFFRASAWRNSRMSLICKIEIYDFSSKSFWNLGGTAGNPKQMPEPRKLLT